MLLKVKEEPTLSFVQQWVENKNPEFTSSQGQPWHQGQPFRMNANIALFGFGQEFN